MADDGARPRWRDVLLVALLAVVIVAGLVHYGGRLSDDTADPAASATPPAVPATTPTAAPPSPTPTAPTSPTSPTTEPERQPEPGTCWDGQAVDDLASCSRPAGVAGLAWVFPSFTPDRAACSPNANTDRSYAVLTSWVCAERALGQRVTIAYDHAADRDELAAWISTKFAAEAITVVPGAHGGRLVARATQRRPARITGTYAGFPYVVSVFAPTKRSAERAWKTLVEQRPAQAVRGRP